MNITLVCMLIAAVVLPLIVKAVKKDMEWMVIGILMAVGLLVSAGAFYAGKAGKTIDVEVWNGEVTGKEQEPVSCSHSYSCNCTTSTSCSGSGSSRSCSTSTSCQTCYEHSHDYDWVVHSNIGDVDIDRVDRQGVHTPPRWAAVQKGEPFSKEHLHTNYIKAVPESVLNTAQNMTSSKFANMIPAYPHSVYDYYRLNRALTVGVPVPDLQDWSNDISNMLKQLGPQKQANVIVLFVKTDDPNYEYALRSAWLGGKKNDIVVIIGTTEYPKIDFVRVMSWTDKELFKVKLRDTLQEMENIDRPTIIEAIRSTTMAEFKRKSMKDFEYLDNEIEPPTWVIVLAFFILIAGNVGTVIYYNHSFGKFNGRRYRRW